MRGLALLAALVACSALAQGARFAVHPIELREMTVAQREIVQAQFDVMLARISDIRLAGSSAIDDALHKPAGKGCETRDECLRFFAEATESLYGVYARVRPDPLGAQLLLTARVVRLDGALIRKVALSAPIDDRVEITETARKLLMRLLDELELDKLSATMEVAQLTPPSGSTLFDVPTVSFGSVRRPAGFALLGLGAGAIVAGGVVAGLAVNARSQLTVDARGAVPQAQAGRAMDAAREAQVATVLLPVGAVVAVIGGLLAWWPANAPVNVAMVAGTDRAGFQIRGRLP